MDKYYDVMVDIETMSTRTNAAIISIAAVVFEIEQLGMLEIQRPFCQNISLQSSIDAGLTVDESTLLWWIKQENVAVLRDDLQTSKVSLKRGLQAFNEWMGSNDQSRIARIWANGPSFDFAKLKSAYEVSGMDVPWDFRKERCVRTYCDVLPPNYYPRLSNHTRHYPLHDCIHQINKLKTAYQCFYK